MASREEVIKEILFLKGIKKDKDVEELDLSNRNLADVMDLRRFRYLKILWLNGNKLRQVKFLGLNFRLRELHLDNNHLGDISGSLRHLTGLTELKLHNNYLTDLFTVVREFDKMHALSELSLYGNPIAQEPEYSLFVINSIPSLTFLDRSKVTLSERDAAWKIYHQNEKKVKDKIAFGRRSQGPPCIYFPASSRKAVTRPKTAANNYMKNMPTFENLEEAVDARQMTKSLNLYSMLDWTTVARIADQQHTVCQFESPRFITYVYQ